MVLAWLITLPSAGVAGALMYMIDRVLGPALGPVVMFGLMVGLAIWMFLHSRHDSVSPSNVNDEWEPTAGVQVDERVEA